MRFKRVILPPIIALLILCITVSVWMFNAPPASAHAGHGGFPTVQRSSPSGASFRANVLCSGSGCTHLDPYATGCAASMYTVKTAFLTAGSVTGRVELEYSAVCQTNWDQIYSGNGIEYLAGCVVRQAGSDGPMASECYQATSFSWINTNMLWSPHNHDSAGGCFVQTCIGGSDGLHAGYYVQTGYY